MSQRMKLDRVLRRRWLLVPLVLALLIPASARAVTVNPTTVFVDSRTRTATLTLSNTGLRPEEIEIYFSFGIPVADELGSVRVIFLDSAGLEQRSIIDYVRAFPRRMRLEPGQTQVIRLLVQPPEDLPAGEYWGRIMVASVGGQAPVQQQQGAVTMEINIRTVIAVGLYYRHGQTETSIGVDSARAAAADGIAGLYLHLNRGGNAAFIGRVVAEVVDGEGNVVVEHVEPVAVHGDMLWRVDIPLPAGAGTGAGYTVRYLIEAVRDGDLNGLLPAEPVRGAVPLEA